MFEDDVHVTVNQKHLLSAGNVTTEDKTAEIVAAVASLVAGRTFVQRAEEKLTRVAFVKKVRNVGFNDGMLTDFQQHLPSPVLGFLGIPKAIIQAMVPIPAATDAGSGSTSGTNPPKKRLQSHFRGSQDSA